MRKSILFGTFQIKCLLFILLTLLLALQSKAQLSGTINVPGGTYPNLASVINALNTQGVGSGGVTINIAAGNPQYAPSGGYQLGSFILNNSVSAAKPITFNGNGNYITASPGTGNPAVNGSYDGIFVLRGIDYVTINNLNLQDTNTVSDATRMEWGYALLKRSSVMPVDGCQHISIKNCTITMTRANTRSIGVFIGNQIPESNNILALNAVEDANSFNIISGNTIQNVYSGIIVTGYNDPSLDYYDQGNLVEGNIIQTYGGTATAAAYGIYLTSQNNSIIRGNTVNNAYGGAAAAGILYGIYHGAASSANTIIRKNTVTLSQSSNAQTAAVKSDISGASSVIYLDSNTVTINSSFTGFGNSIYGVYNKGTCYQAYINYNKVSNVSHANDAYIIGHEGALAPGGTLNINQNTIDGYTKTGTSYNTVYCIYSGGTSNSNATINILGNSIKNVTCPAASTASVYGIYDNNFSVGYRNYTHDSVTSINAGKGSCYAFQSSAFNAVSVNMTQNYVADISCADFNGYYFYQVANTVIQKNIVSGVNCTSNSGTVTGIYIGGGENASVSNNIIQNLQSAAGTYGGVWGIYCGGEGTAISIYNNFISDLKTPSANASSPLFGINLASGDSIFVYHNTINLNPVSTGANFGATGIYYASAIKYVELLNNIIRVNAQPAGTGIVAALRRSAGTAGIAPSNLSLATNGNVYYVPAATNAFIYGEGTALPLTNAYNTITDTRFNTTCGLYKAFMAPREVQAFTENNLSAGTLAGTFIPGSSSAAKGIGVTTALPGAAVDFNGVARPANPDPGALQFAGTYSDASAPAIYYTPLQATSYCVTAPILSAVITDPSGVDTAAGSRPRLYYRKASEPDVFGSYPADNNAAFNGWKYTEGTGTAPGFSFTFDYTRLTGPVTGGDSLVYFVVAQDKSATKNTGSYHAAFAAPYCPSGVNLSGAVPAAFSPGYSGFKILPVGSFTALSSRTQVCSKTSTLLNVAPFPYGMQVQWQKDNGTGTFTDIPGASGDGYTDTITAVGSYRALLQCAGSLIATTAPAGVTMITPQVTGTTPGTHCGPGSVTLAATATTGSTVYWYKAGNEVPVASGNSFATGMLTATGTYYAAAGSGASGNAGRTAPGANASGTSSIEYGISFNAAQPFTLVSADVYPKGAAGSLTIRLTDAAGNTLQSAGPFAIPVGTGATMATGATPVTLPLNFSIPQGSGYQLRSSQLSSPLLTDNFGVTYPLPIGTAGSITSGVSNGALSASAYHLFYNLRYIEGCLSPRVPVTATITPSPGLVTTAPAPGICRGGSLTLTTGSANKGYTYVWNPGPLTGASVSVSPTATATYYVTAVDSSTGPYQGCTALDSISVYVNDPPPSPTVTPATSTACPGDAVPLNGVLTNGSGNAVIGRDAGTNRQDGYPAPYQSYNGGSKQQIMIRASELTAAGLVSGSLIKEVSFQVAQPGLATPMLDGFQIFMGHTSTASLGKTAFIRGLARMLDPVSYVPVSGVNKHTLTRSFEWNGMDNLVIEVDYTSSNTGTVYGTQMSNTHAGYVSSAWYYSVILPAPSIAGMIAIAVPSDTSSKRPNVVLGFTNPIQLRWSPLAGLYKDPALTIPLTAADTNSIVYAAPASSGSYAPAASLKGCLSTPANPPAAISLSMPTATISPADTGRICTGGNITLNGTAGTGLTYQWNLNGTAITGATNAAYSAAAPGNYTLTITGTTCSDTSPVTRVIIDDPGAAIRPAGTASYCTGSSIVLRADTAAGFTYQWMLAGADIPGATNSSYTAAAAGSYTVKVTNSRSCTSVSAPTVVTEGSATASVTASGPTAFCAGANVLLQANTGTGLTYRWQKNGADIPGASADVYTATATGDYTVVVSANGTCSATSAPVTVTANPLPPAAISPAGPVTICAGDSQQLAVSPGYTYQWQKNGIDIPGKTNNVLFASTTGNYTVAVTDSKQCSDTGTAVTVTVQARPNALITPAGSPAICSGGGVTLNANTGTGLLYQWQLNGTDISGATSASYQSTQTGSYTVLVSDAFCSATAAPIRVSTLQAAVTPAGPVTVCQGTSLLMQTDSVAGLTYQWKKNGSDISGAVGSSYTTPNTSGGNYTVLVSNGACSTLSAPVAVTVNPVPANIVNITSNELCSKGDTTTLYYVNPVAGYTYQWRKGLADIPGATGSTYVADTMGGYSLKITNTHHCSSTSLTVTVRDGSVPLQHIRTVGPTTICQGDNAELHANPGHIQWQLNGVDIPGATDTIYTTSVPGNYSYTIGMLYTRCTGRSDTVTVSVSIPVPVIMVVHDTVLSVAGNYTSYQWQYNNIQIPGATSATYTATQNGDYTVTVTDSIGCPGTSDPKTVRTGTSGVRHLPHGAAAVQLYPNPAYDVVHVTASVPVHISVYGIDGKEFIHKKNTGLAGQIDVHALANGIYMVRVFDASNTLLQVEMLVIKR